MTALRTPSPLRTGAILLVLDVIGLLILLNAAHLVRLGEPVDMSSWHVWAVTALVLLTLYVMDVYRADAGAEAGNRPLQTVVGVMIGGVLAAAFVYLTGPGAFDSVFGRGVLPIALLAFAIWAASWRAWFVRLGRRVRRTLRWLCLGDPVSLDGFVDDFLREEDIGCLHVLTLANEGIAKDDRRLCHRGAVGDIGELLGESWNGIVLALEGSLPETVVKVLMNVRFRGVPIMTMTEFYERIWMKVPVLHVRDGWFVQAPGFGIVHDDVYLRLKRVFDLVAALLLSAALLPVIGVAAIAIKLDSRGPVIYRQPRTGRNGGAFMLFKLRSMVANAERDGVRWSGPDDPRVTRVGRLLRRFRIDETPQLWNVLRGDMSFIGPRPERPEINRQLEAEIPYYDLRHLVAPGITGWAQVMYRYGSSVEDARQKLQYDLYYIKNHSFALDLAILLKTLRIVLTGKGT